MNQLRVVKSFNNGIEVLHRQHFFLYREVGSAVWMAGPGAPLLGIAKYLGRLGWTAIGNDGRSFTKGEVKVNVWDAARPATNSVSINGSHKVSIEVALPSFATGLPFLAQLSKACGGTPTVVFASGTELNSEVMYTPLEEVKAFVRWKFTTQDLLKALFEEAKDQIIEKITGEELTKVIDLYNFLDDPKSVLPFGIRDHTTFASGTRGLIGNANEALKGYSNVGVLDDVPFPKATQVPSGKLKSFLTQNKTIEIVFEYRKIQIYANQEQINRYIKTNSYVITDEINKKIYKENIGSIYSKSQYTPD
jgi:hypothetical protein